MTAPKALGLAFAALFASQLAAAQTLALPVHPSLGRVEVNSIVAACNALGGLL